MFLSARCTSTPILIDESDQKSKAHTFQAYYFFFFFFKISITNYTEFGSLVGFFLKQKFFGWLWKKALFWRFFLPRVWIQTIYHWLKLVNSLSKLDIWGVSTMHQKWEKKATRNCWISVGKTIKLQPSKKVPSKTSHVKKGCNSFAFANKFQHLFLILNQCD